MDTAATQVGKITFAQLGEAITELRRLADRLDAFCTGNDQAWTPTEIADAHALIAFTGAQVNVVRGLRGAAHRQAGVLRLDDHR